MTRIFLRAANPIFLCLIVLFGIGIQTSLFREPPLHYFQPDIVLIAVIWCALRRDFAVGGIITLVLGELAEIHSAAPSGIMLMLYLLVYFSVRLVMRLIVLPDLTALVLLTLGASVAWHIGNLVILMMLGVEVSFAHTLTYLFPGAVSDGLLALWAFKLLDRFDWLTFKSRRAQQILEDELQLEAEGF